MEVRKNRVLAICGEPLILAQAKAGLNAAFSVFIASNFDDAEEILSEEDIPVVILCLGNRDLTAELAELKTREAFKNKSLIVLSEKDNSEEEITAFENGAKDYCVRRKRDYSALIKRIENINLATHCEIVRKPLASHKGKTLLIAEDVELNREIVSALLSEIDGLSFDFAADGKEALEKFEKSPDLYSLIFMDAQMPVMNGTEATKAIRNSKLARAREIPIVAMTAAFDEKDVAEYMKSGMDGYIKKPMGFDELVDALDRYS